MGKGNLIILELERRSAADVNGLANRINTLAKSLIEISSAHHKRVIQMMPEFDLHDESHLARVMDIMGDFIGAERVGTLSDVELLLLVASAYLHDCGMAPAEWERNLMCLTEGMEDLKDAENSICHDGLSPFSYSEALKFIKGHKALIYGEYEGDVRNWPFSENSEAKMQEALAEMLTDYQNFRNGYVSALKGCRNLADFKKLNNEIRVDYIRTRHHCTSYRYILNALPVFASGINEKWVNKLVRDLAKICQAHGEDLLYVKNELATDSAYCPGENANLQFVAMMLRLGDICHYSSDRAPLVLRNAKRFMSEYSYGQWTVKDASVNYAIADGKISYYAYCDTPDKFYRLHDYMDWIDVEISDFYSLQRGWADRYKLPLKDVDRSGINYDESNFRPVRGKQFTLEQNKIIRLLMGVGLYKDPYASLRELYQNAMDACRCQICKMSARGLEYKGQIEFGLQRNGKHCYLYCRDNGVGMSEEIIEKYLLKIGNSYYKSADFYRAQAAWGGDFEPVSQFGIGILSCFMICTRIEIITKTEESLDYLSCCIEGPREYFYYSSPQPAEIERMGTSGTIVKLLLKDEFAAKLNDEPIEKLGLVLQYERSEPFFHGFSEYNDIYDRWEGSLYKKINDFINKTPRNIMAGCRFSDGSVVPIFDKPFAVRIGEYGVTEADRNFIDSVISRRMFFLNSITLAGIQDIIKPYPINLAVDGIEYDSIISMPLPGMPEMEDESALFHCLMVRNKNLSVDGIAVDGQSLSLKNMYFDQLTRTGSINFTGKSKPRLSVDRKQIINLPEIDDNVCKRIVLEEIKAVLEIAMSHIKEYGLENNAALTALIWKYIFDRMRASDVLFVNNLASSELGRFRWPSLSGVLGKEMTICDFMAERKITIPEYDCHDFDLLTEKLVFSKLFAAREITVDESNNVMISCGEHTPLPEKKHLNFFERYLVPVSNENSCFREYDIVTNLYPLVPERLTKALIRHEIFGYHMTNTNALNVTEHSNTYVAFFSQDARLVHPRLGLYMIRNHGMKKRESLVYSFEDKRSDFQFMDFGYDSYVSKQGMMFLAYIAPCSLNDKEKEKLEEYRDSDSEYYKGVKEGWTILVTGMRIDNIIILPGKRTRQEMLGRLSDAFWSEYGDFEFRFLDGSLVGRLANSLPE